MSAEDHLPRLPVEVAGRLVGQEQHGLVDQGPGDGHALLFAARQLARPRDRLVLEADLPEHLAGPAEGVSLRGTPPISRGKATFSSGGELGQEVVELEDEADLAVRRAESPTSRIGPGEVLAVETDRGPRTAGRARPGG